MENIEIGAYVSCVSDSGGSAVINYFDDLDCAISTCRKDQNAAMYSTFAAVWSVNAGSWDKIVWASDLR